MITVKYNNTKFKIDPGMTVGEFGRINANEKYPVMLGRVDGKLTEMWHKLDSNCEISFITMGDRIGINAYRRSCTMLTLASVRKVLGEDKAKRIIQHFAIGCGYYFTIEGVNVTTALVKKIEKTMWDYVDKDLPIEKKSVKTREAREIWKRENMPEKDELFRYRMDSYTNVYTLDDFSDYYYGYMCFRTGDLKHFKLSKFEKGFVLHLPRKRAPLKLLELPEKKNVFNAQLEGEKWAERLGIENVAQLNQKVTENQTFMPILLAETQQEQRISDMAEKIAKRSGVRFIMIAGPSSSGKTTFSQKLCAHLIANGVDPHYVGVDNYFKNREDTPVGPDGKKNYEDIEAIDVKLFNKDMKALLAGKKVEMPSFDFIEGKRVYNGDWIQLSEKDVLVIEGIHCLNDKLSYSLPEDSKFKIFITAMTQINIDDHNYLSSSDGRLLRRLVRDNRTRGASAAHTLAMWEGVRHGEEKNIFPYQYSADVIFNSALIYEIAVLKPYVQPILFKVHEEEPEYEEAKRLLKFLDYFIGIPGDHVPMDSILREFIGGGCFHM